jgi:hypothetical protein
MSLANTVIVGKINFHNIVERSETCQLEAQLRKSHKWVVELATQKSTDLPCLEEVEIGEDVGWPGRWEYPEDLRKAFGTAGIHLVIRVASAYHQYHSA